MPRTKLDPLYFARRFNGMIQKKCIEKKIKEYELIQELDISSTSFWRKKKNGSWSLEEIRTIFKYLDFDEEEKLKVLA